MFGVHGDITTYRSAGLQRDLRGCAARMGFLSKSKRYCMQSVFPYARPIALSLLLIASNACSGDDSSGEPDGGSSAGSGTAALSGGAAGKGAAGTSSNPSSAGKGGTGPKAAGAGGSGGK